MEKGEEGLDLWFEILSCLVEDVRNEIKRLDGEFVVPEYGI